MTDRACRHGFTECGECFYPILIAPDAQHFAVAAVALNEVGIPCAEATPSVQKMLAFFADPKHAPPAKGNHEA